MFRLIESIPKFFHLGHGFVDPAYGVGRLQRFCIIGPNLQCALKCIGGFGVSSLKNYTGTQLVFVLHDYSRRSLDNSRNEQVNFRLGTDERMRIDFAAKRKTFHGLYDFIRWPHFSPPKI